MSVYFLPHVYSWVRICRPHSSPVIVHNAIIEHTEIDGILKISGQVENCVDSVDERVLPKKYIDVEVDWWDIRRFFGYKTKKILVPDIPEGYILDIQAFVERMTLTRNNFSVYSKYEMQDVIFKVPSFCIELSP